MQAIITEIKRFDLREAIKNVLVIVSVLSIFDISLTVLNAFYLNRNIEAFLGKSNAVILSDLLFIEGTIILTLGIFIAVVRAWQETRPLPSQSGEETSNAETPDKKHLHFSTQMMIIGAVLIGLSITVGTLLR